MSPHIATRSSGRSRLRHQSHALAILLLLLCGPTASALAPCESFYEHALTIVKGHCYLPAQSRTEAVKQLSAGWRSYFSEADKSKPATFELLGRAEGLVRSSGPNLSATARDEAGRTVRILASCLWDENSRANLYGIRRDRAAEPLLSDVEIVESHDGVLDHDFATLTLRLLDADAKPVPVSRLESVELKSQSGAVDVTSMFTLTKEGGVSLKEVAPFRRMLSKRIDPFRLSVRASNGTTRYESTADFVIGRFRMRVRLTRPSGTSFSLRSIPVWAVSDRTAMTFDTVTNADGIAEFLQLPDDHYRIASIPEIGAKRYYARTEVELNRDPGLVDLPLNSTIGEIVRRPNDQGLWRADEEVRTSEWINMFFVAFQLIDNRLHLQDVTRYINDVPEPSDSEAVVNEALEHDRRSAPDPDKRFVAVRVYDDRGRIVFRRAVPMNFASWSEGSRAVYPIPSLIVEMPAHATGHIEFDSVDPRLRGSFDLEQMIAAAAAAR